MQNGSLNTERAKEIQSESRNIYPNFPQAHLNASFISFLFLKKQATSSTQLTDCPTVNTKLGFPGSSTGKESACNAGDSHFIPGWGRSPGEGIGYPLQYSRAPDVRWLRICLHCGRPGLDPWVGKIPWRRDRLPTPVFLPGEFPWTEEPGGLQFMDGISKSRTGLSD